MAIATLTSNENGANSLIDINANFVDLDTTKADLASPTFTGTPSLPTGTTAVTQSAGDNSTKIATTAYVNQLTKSVVSALLTSGNVSLTTTPAQIIFDSELVDRNSDHNTGTGTFTTPSAGQYRIDCFLTTTVSGAGDDVKGIIYKNGSALYYYGVRGQTNTADYDNLSFSTILTLAANDTIKIYAQTTSGTGTVYANSTNGASIFSITSVN
jgi:C1q domain